MRFEVSIDCIVYFAQNKPNTWITKGLLSALLGAVLLCVGLEAQAPELFADVSARAAQARDAGNVLQAMDLYKQATQLKPDWQEGWWNLGMLAYGANQYPVAIGAFTHLLQIVPTAMPAMALRGLCEFETAAYDDALRDLEQAVAHGAASDPRNEQILRFHLGQLLTRAGRYRDALDQYEVFARHQVESSDLYAAIGMAGMQNAHLLSELAAQDRAVYEAAGRAAYPLLADDSTESSHRFAELFARYPATPNLHFFYGFLLFPHEAMDLTIDQLQREVAIAPGNHLAYAYLAFALMIASRYADAERVLASAPQANVDQDIAQVVLGRSLAENGKAERGEELLKQVLERNPDNMEAHLGLVAIYSHEGRREDARRERLACLHLEK